MQINAIIHEQIEWDGSIKSFQLKEREDLGDLWVAFPGDYDDEPNGPFHFLEREYETWYNEKRASCACRRIASCNFYMEDGDYIFKTGWHRISTKEHQLTYYSLYLPEFAVPIEISFSDPFENK